MPEDDGSCLRESEGRTGRAGRAARAKAERPTSMLCKMNHKQSCFDEVQSKGREQPEQVLSLKNERTYQDSEFGLATIRDDVRLRDLKKGKTAKRSQDQHDGMLR